MDVWPSLMENQMRQQFGEAYDDYARRTPRFITNFGGKSPAA
jgi:protein-S-isoprenylcysteine O-methyltransferase Ste14